MNTLKTLKKAGTTFQTVEYQKNNGEIIKINIQRIVSYNPVNHTVVVWKTGYGYRRIRVNNILTISQLKLGRLETGNAVNYKRFGEALIRFITESIQQKH